MTMLAQYAAARTALAEATRVDQVLSLRDETEHVKLYARQIRDRTLLADATEFQMRCERRLGVLLEALEEAGQLARRGGQRKAAAEGEPPLARLKDIGVDLKLSAKARQAAALRDDTFEDIVTGMREKLASGHAILVDPVKAAAKDADIAARRAAHAERTLGGGTVEDLGRLALDGFRAKFIGSDPQWKFLTRSAAGEGRSANVHYKTEAVDRIKALPVRELAADDCAFGMWMVDWCPRDALDLMEHYGFAHVTTLYTWVKTNGAGTPDRVLDPFDNSTWHLGQGYYTRANPEDCWLGIKGNPRRLYADVRQLIVAPLMEHSRKPDEWLERSERLFEGPYLELQARRPRPGWVSWGDEIPAPRSGVGGAIGATPSSSPAGATDTEPAT